MDISDIIRFGKRKHCGGLKESLATSKYISSTAFKKLVKKYLFYGFDSRCGQILYICFDQSEKYTWLFIEIQRFKQ